MKTISRVSRKWLAATLGMWAGVLSSDSALPPAGSVEIKTKVGLVQVLPAGAVPPLGWVRTETNQFLGAHWRVRTGADSRMTLQWPDGSAVEFGAQSELEILPPPVQGGSGLRLFKGLLSFFHRDQPGRMRVITRGMDAGIDGTEFVLAVEEVNGVERTTISVIDGIVSVTNVFDSLVLTNLQQAVVDEGQAPRRTAGFVVNNVLQWAFYYPAVLDLHDLRDLPLAPMDEPALAGSLAAYRAGDLLAALSNYPTGRQPVSDAERLYRAALLLSVGQVAQAEGILATLPAGEPTARAPRLAGALRLLIAAVNRQTNSPAPAPLLPSELLAASYYEQSRAVGEDSLRAALTLARQAATNSPEFSFAWARVAELEFGFGHTREAAEALDRSLALAPRNAQALALRGFVLAARDRTREAREMFDRAIAVDPALGNAWLGRGLVRIQRGEAAAGRADLLMAAALEPQRAVLRSYLAKAFADAGDLPLARHELDLARRLDPADPTAWLYSALVNAEANRINTAVHDLERSVDLNDNRRVFRSSELLDEDLAVRRANLARIYRDAGLVDWSVREAGRAVASDYANYSAHLFLAESYNALRDTRQFSLRYEPAALSEYLLANLLAPAQAGPLGATLSLNEYSALFERDRLGLVSQTGYASDGSWAEEGAVYGTFGNTAFSLEGIYRQDLGYRPNNDSELRQLSAQVRQQVGPNDTVWAQAFAYKAEAGDVAPRYDASSYIPGYHTTETQEPTVFAGWRHQWRPGLDTVLFGAWQDARFEVANPQHGSLLIAQNGGPITQAAYTPWDLNYQSDIQVGTAELQQIWRQGRWTTVAGARVQAGTFDIHSQQMDLGGLGGVFETDLIVQQQETDFFRGSGYVYETFQAGERLTLVAGLAYDWMSYPRVFRTTPVTADTQESEQWSPKLGLVWQPRSNTVLRAAWTRSLSGVSLEQSARIEPTQVAGFNQTFRSAIPEGVEGAHAGESFESFGLAWEQRWGRGTYAAISGEWLRSKVRQSVGAFRLDTDISDFAFVDPTRENLDYSEPSLVIDLNQLLGREFAVGARYRLSYAHLETDFPELSGLGLPNSADYEQDQRARLQRLDLYGVWNHPSGLFAQVLGRWYSQRNEGYDPGLPGDEFWQLDVWGGYRFARRRVEVAVGVLNLTDRSYQLNPLNLVQLPPQDRAFVARLRLSF